MIVCWPEAEEPWGIGEEAWVPVLVTPWSSFPGPGPSHATHYNARRMTQENASKTLRIYVFTFEILILDGQNWTCPEGRAWGVRCSWLGSSGKLREWAQIIELFSSLAELWEVHLQNFSSLAELWESSLSLRSSQVRVVSFPAAVRRGRASHQMVQSVKRLRRKHKDLNLEPHSLLESAVAPSGIPRLGMQRWEHL